MKINRKDLVIEIMENFHAIKNKMHVKLAKRDFKDCVTYSQLFVLAAIKRNSGMGIKEISKKLNISPSAATQLVDCLVENHCVVRQADPKDHRALRIDLSKKGLNYLNTLKNQHVKMAKILFSALTDEELKTYLQLHKKILTNVLEKNNL